MEISSSSTIDSFQLTRYLVLKIDGKYAVQKESSGVASFRDTEEDAIRLAFKLLRDSGSMGRERIVRQPDKSVLVWLEE